MQKTKLLFVLSCCFLLSSSAYAERKALLIGNSAYRVGALRNPSNDVDKMMQKLRTLGFRHNITVRKNLTKAQMKQVIRQFSQQLKAGDEALFYYSGHGVQVNNLNYLIPLKTDIQAEHEVPDEALPLRFVLQSLAHAKSRLNLVILDACRDNPFKSRYKSSSRGLARLNQNISQSTLVAFSASPGQISDDGNRGNGLYTQYLLKHIATPNITINQMFNRVRKEVFQASGRKQLPKEESGLLDDVVLNRKGETEAHRQQNKQVIKIQPAHSTVSKVKDGYGVIKYKTGDIYRGIVKNGKPEGLGAFFFKTGNHYEGMFKNGNYNGKGIFTSQQGYRVEGRFINNKLNGQVSIRYNPSDHRSRYYGMYKNNKIEGHGIMIFKSGNRYKGAYKNNKRNGQGVMTYKSGVRYEGGYKNDKRNGQGVMIFKSGARYEGTWKDGTYNGYGIYTFPKNSPSNYYKGTWKNGKYDHGILYYKSGKQERYPKAQ